MKTLEERFWNKVNKSDGCWNWTGCLDSRGYGRIIGKVNGKWESLYSHRLSWELENKQPFPDNLESRHICNNRKCVNPAHINPGTTAQNAADSMKAGTFSGFLIAHKLGERNVNAKLTRTQVNEILKSVFSMRKIAIQYGVCSQTIYRIKHGLTWGRTLKEVAL
jgi:hypothetical protein